MNKAEIYRKSFEDRINQIQDPDLRKICIHITNESKFFTWPAATGMHHNYRHGLVVHTMEVFDYCKALMDIKYEKAIDKDIVLTAALWHDYAKIYEYIPDIAIPNHYVTGVYRDNIHHICGSAIDFSIRARGKINRMLEDEIVHCILSHHGFVDLKDGVKKPKTREAIILSTADQFSAWMGATKDFPE